MKQLPALANLTPRHALPAEGAHGFDHDADLSSSRQEDYWTLVPTHNQILNQPTIEESPVSRKPTFALEQVELPVDPLDASEQAYRHRMSSPDNTPDWARVVVNESMIVIAYNLGNLLRRLVLPLAIQSWSLTSLQQRLFKTGGRLIRHARYFILQLAESYWPRAT